MKNFRTVVTITFLFSLCYIEVPAQNAWSLRRCIDYAIENNIAVKQKALEKENNSIRVETAKYSRLPDLTANVGQNFYFGRSPSRDGTYVDQSQASSSLGINTSIPIFTGFRLPNELKARKFDLQSSMELLNKAKEDVSLQVTSLYLNTLFNKELVAIGQELVALSTQQLEKSELLVKNGKSPESVLYEAKATLANDRLNLTQAENALMLSLLDLRQLLNLENDQNFDIVIPDMEQITKYASVAIVPLDSAISYSVANRPSIKAAKFALESSKRNLKVMQSDYYPKLSLGASYSNSYFHSYSLPAGERNTTFVNQFRNNGNESIGLSLSIPIFNRFMTRNQIKMAHLSITGQELNLLSSKQEMYKEIEQAYYNTIAAKAKEESALQAMQSAKIALDYEMKKLDLGKSTIFEYNNTKTQYEKAISEWTKARYEFVFQSKVLDFYNGKELSL